MATNIEIKKAWQEEGGPKTNTNLLISVQKFLPSILNTFVNVCEQYRRRPSIKLDKNKIFQFRAFKFIYIFMKFWSEPKFNKDSMALEI